ncbi:MAG: hypothetical protein AB1505_09160 [Candidatus Latescibacterota bacterium]
MDGFDLQTDARGERLATIVERCLGSAAAYRLFDMLAAIARLDLDSRLEYMEMVKSSGAYTEEEITSIERLILSGAARYFKEVIDRVRQERVAREIDELLSVQCPPT